MQADKLDEGRARMDVATTQLEAAKQEIEQEKERVRQADRPGLYSLYSKGAGRVEGHGPWR